MAASKRTTQELLAAREKNVPRGVLTAHPIVVDRAEGGYVWDRDGRRYLDSSAASACSISAITIRASWPPSPNSSSW